MLTVLLLWYFNSPLYQHSNTRDCGRSPHDLAYGSVRQVSRRPIFHFQGPSSCSCRRFYLDSTFVPHIRDSFPESRCGRKPYQHRNFVSLLIPCHTIAHSNGIRMLHSLGLTWVLWLVGAILITQYLCGGGVDCTKTEYCHQLYHSLGFAWGTWSV